MIVKFYFSLSFKGISITNRSDSKYFELKDFEIYFMTSTKVVANKVMVHLNWTDIISCPRKFTILDKKIDTRT